jgi:hypothetical protein
VGLSLHLDILATSFSIASAGWNEVGSRKPSRGVVTENSVRSENTEVPIIRETIVATTVNSLFVALFALSTTARNAAVSA